MSSDKKTVPLKRPFPGANGQMVLNVTLREPTASEVWSLGEPQTWVRAAGGMALVDNQEAISAYAERLIVDPDPLLARSMLKTIDAIAVKDAIIGFFQVEAPAASQQSATTSSSSSASSTPNPAAS